MRESFDGGMDALASGQLTIRDGCVFLVYDGQSKAVVWPTGTVLNASRDALVLADGRVLPNGVDLQLGGGSVPYAEALTFTSGASAAAEACAKRADSEKVFVAGSDSGVVDVV